MIPAWRCTTIVAGWVQLGLLAWVCQGATMTLVAADANRDEGRVRPYVLPDPLVGSDGRRVTTAEAWTAERRPALMRQFESQVYGRALPKVGGERFETVLEEPEAMGGRAVRRRVAMVLGARIQPALRFSMFLPKTAAGPAPVFFGIHVFDTSRPWPEIAVARRGVQEGGVPAAAPGTLVGRRVAEQVLARGYGLISMDIDDLVPDSATNYSTGVFRQLGMERTGPPGPEEPGALAAWAWGLSRIVDYVERTPGLDARRAIAIGHSRMGKAALWAAATDSRISAVISNNSGCGGAALNRRNFGETIAIITRAFPHWFCGNFATYAGREAELPVDQHELLALIAPRPVYVASAADDWWSDPKGEYLALVHASPVYRLFGATGLTDTNLPPVDTVVGRETRYHLRAGQHDLTDFDWEKYLEFADQMPGSRSFLWKPSNAPPRSPGRE